MKKLLTALLISGAVGATCFTLTRNGTYAKEVEALGDNNISVLSDELSSLPEGATTYIPMSKDAFSNWNDYHANAGDNIFADLNATYWPECWTFGNFDTMYRGEVVESQMRISLKTVEWTQYTRYIYFQWGGANNSDDQVRLTFHYQITNPETSEKQWVSETHLNDTHVDNSLVFRYFEISEENWAKCDTTNGFQMYIELYDNRSSNYGFHNFGYLHVNQTFESTHLAMRDAHVRTMTDTRPYNNRRGITHNYVANAMLRKMFLAEATSVSESFERTDSFYNNWYFDNNYYNANGATDYLYFEKAISTGDYRPHDKYLPFNKEGEGFFRGWHENEAAESDGEHLNEGFVKGDGHVYRFLSMPYTLNKDQHFVSIKMAGTASFHIIDHETGEDLAWIDAREYKSDVEQYVHKGFNTCTLRRHIINLSAYAGRTVQFGLSDISKDGWGAAYFDDFNCNYDPTSGIRVDEIAQNCDNRTYYTAKYDIYINSVHIETDASGIKYKNGADGIADETDMYAAVKFVSDYTNWARQGTGLDICLRRTSDEAKTLLNTYNGLSSVARQIVSASDDYEQQTGDYNSTEPYDYLAIKPVITNLGHNLSYLAQENGITLNGAQLSLFFGLHSENNMNVIILPVLMGVSLCFLLVMFIRKRRLNKNK